MLLVTGITGHTGMYFLQELIDNEYPKKIRCIVRDTSDTSQLEKSGLKFEKIIGDINDSNVINRNMDGVNTIMHIYNIHHSHVIVQAAIKNKIDRVILVHTTGIYSNFKSASEEYKKIEKGILDLQKSLECSTDITILRPSMIYGDLCDRNISKFIKMIDRFRIFPLIDGGKSLIQPVNARDLGKAYYQVLLSEGTRSQNYDLTGKNAIRVVDALKIINKELNKKTIFISIPLKLAIIIAYTLNILTFGRVNVVEKVQRMGENRNYSHKKAKMDFGYEPMSFEQGVKIEVEEYLGKRKG